METVRDLIRDTETADGVAVEAPGRRTPYRYDDVAANVWKAGNLLRHYGAGPGRPVAVTLHRSVEGPDPASSPAVGPGTLLDTAEPLFAILGAMAVGAPVATNPGSHVETPVLVAPTESITDRSTAAGTSVLAYGDAPPSPDVAHFERERWSENPVEPPEPLAADHPAVVNALGGHSHGTLVGESQAPADRLSVEEGVAVRLSRSVASPRVLVAGVLAPLRVGLTIRPTAPDVDDGGGITLVDHEGAPRDSLEDPDLG